MKYLFIATISFFIISCSKTYEYTDEEAQKTIFKQAFGTDLPQNITDFQIAIKDGDNNETVWMKFTNKDGIIKKLVKKDSISKETNKVESAVIKAKVIHTMFDGYEALADSSIVSLFNRYSIDSISRNSYIIALNQAKESNWVYSGFFKTVNEKKITTLTNGIVPITDNYIEEPNYRESYLASSPEWIPFKRWQFIESEIDFYFKPYYKSLSGKYTLSGFTYLYLNKQTNDIYYFASGYNTVHD
jgi:hypothetical protein